MAIVDLKSNLSKAKNVSQPPVIATGHPEINIEL